MNPAPARPATVTPALNRPFRFNLDGEREYFCRKCETWKVVACFSKRGRHRRQSYCKPCACAARRFYAQRKADAEQRERDGRWKLRLASKGFAPVVTHTSKDARQEAGR